MTENVDYFRLNLEIYGFNAKNKTILHLPPSKLTVFQRGPYYSGIRPSITCRPIRRTSSRLRNNSNALKEYLHSNYFYSLNEFCN